MVPEHGFVSHAVKDCEVQEDVEVTFMMRLFHVRGDSSTSNVE